MISPSTRTSSLKEQIQTPSKEGLSMFYRGKSESFTNLSDVSCLQDLPKKPRKDINNFKVETNNTCRTYPSCPSLPPAIHVYKK
ncbi:hypothetical protein ZOSMA_17G00480 [Zostera marina]|uniref:Uncharacterized protein n=1 Tax=Zostera marina TaxID=29655 RepID=A0A0K9PQY9_ZOSMR|nr:hypothetical protein ZOSMA_17G00480 [Zostera marina]